MKTLTLPQSTALKNILKAQLSLWDIGNLAEKLFEDTDINTRSDAVDSACAGLNTPTDVDRLTEDDLLRIFELN